eukprot:m.311871 g.311871  ORF g.311871 m.311871 type:complete len:343 (+) comp15962_c1_seq2:173-1201(+)
MEAKRGPTDNGAPAKRSKGQKAGKRSQAKKPFTVIEKLGEGQYARVFKAKQGARLVAVKEFKMGSVQEARDGIHPSTLKELKYLQELRHVNIIQMIDVVYEKRQLSAVLEFCVMDLEQISKHPSASMQTSVVKEIMLQCFHGLEFLHSRWVLHRDIKSNNIFVTDQGVVKIADFGLATTAGVVERNYTPTVVTIHYRAPELLYGTRHYTGAIDVWAMACVMAELQRKRWLFAPVDSEMAQLKAIAAIRGPIGPDVWPEAETFELFYAIEGQKLPLADLIPTGGAAFHNLLEHLLHYSPRHRFTATQALQHDYFSSSPGPITQRKLAEFVKQLMPDNEAQEAS